MIRDFIDLVKSAFRFCGNAFLGFFLLAILYLIFAVVFTLIPSNIFSERPTSGITIYIKTNGVHTDLVLPKVNKYYNWNEKILPEDFFPDTVETHWTAFGWGDKGFYLDTPNWSDLKFSTAFNALFLPTPTAMHVTLYEKIKEGEHTKKIILTNEEYLLLCDYIYKSFQKNEKENFILINCCHYSGLNDNFYEAEGSYHLFNTCNNWSNSALKTAGVKTAFWAPFDRCIFYHF